MNTIYENINTPENYIAALPLIINLPKRGYTLRPGVVPQINDRLVYQAIADLLAPNFKPEPNVYSNKLAGNGSRTMFLPGVKLWVAFQDKAEELCHKYPYVVETDITAYFDHINHNLLISRITDLFKNILDRDTLKELKKLLPRLLGKWAIGLNKFGIPQINDPSSFMGNLYLDELDKWFSIQQIESLRYVDDIRIFAESEAQARSFLANTIVKLREMGLYIAAGKTKIQPSEEVINQLEKARSKINEIDGHLGTRQRECFQIATKLLKNFFIELVDEPRNFNDRHFRYCLNRFKRLYGTGYSQDLQERAIKEVISRFISMPESTNVFVDYLSLFPENELIYKGVLDFLESPYNIYPWQEMHLMELLIRANLTSKLKKRGNQIANGIINSGKHPASLIKAYIFQGKNGTYADRRDMRAKYPQEPREELKRAIIFSTQEMQLSERKYFYQNIAEDSYPIKQTINYVESLNRPIYSYYNPPNPFEIESEDHDSDDMLDLGSEYFI